MQSADFADGPAVARLLTIVVVSSPVPSNPDTTTLRAVFRSLALVPSLTRCSKIIHFDGPQPALAAERKRAYSVFKNRTRVLAATDPAFLHSRVYASDKFLFAAHNLASAVSHINTTFFLSLQHDYMINRRFAVHRLLRTMIAVPVVRHVRLNMRANAPARGFDGVVENASLPGLLVPLTRTCGWSDAPHIASTSYYRSFVIPYNWRDHRHGARKFKEESIHYPMQRNFEAGGCWATKQQAKRGDRPLVWPANFDDFGTYLYGVASARDGFYTVHRSLRGHAPQWGLEHDPKGDIRGRPTLPAAAAAAAGPGTSGRRMRSRRNANASPGVRHKQR